MGTAGAVAIAIGAWLAFRMDESPRLAPDSRYYQELASGALVPRPFSMRPGIPLMAGSRTGTWVWVTFLGVLMQGVAMYWLAGGGTRGIVAELLLLGLPGGARISVRYPVLVDAFALGATLMVASQTGFLQQGVWFYVLLLALGREQAPILLGLLTGRWELALAGGLVTFAVSGFFEREPNSTDNAFIREPWTAIQGFRRGAWFSVSVALLPWGVVLPLALTTGPWAWTTALGLALGVLPALRATDAARVAVWGAPVLILVALQAPIPSVAWPLVLLLHWFNPYRGG